jgi:hypothetical protein
VPRLRGRPPQNFQSGVGILADGGLELDLTESLAVLVENDFPSRLRLRKALIHEELDYVLQDWPEPAPANREVQLTHGLLLAAGAQRGHPWCQLGVVSEDLKVRLGIAELAPGRPARDGQD